MATVTVQAILGEDRQLHITLPEDIPAGPVEVTITSTAPREQSVAPGAELTREQLRALLAEAGALSTKRYAPPDASPLTDEEREALGTLPPGAPDTWQLIDEDRGPR